METRIVKLLPLELVEKPHISENWKKGVNFKFQQHLEILSLVLNGDSRRSKELMSGWIFIAFVCLSSDD